MEVAIAVGGFDGDRHAGDEPLWPRDILVAAVAQANAAALVTPTAILDAFPAST